MSSSHPILRAEVRALLVSSRDATDAWPLLERAHILSQPMAGPHVRVHLAMFSRAWSERRWREVLGQIPRIALAAPGSWLGRYPRGNRGTTAISMFRPEPLPEDLARFLDDQQAK